MNIKYLTVAAAAWLASPFLALAQGQTQAASDQSSAWANLLWGVAPILILLAVFIVVIRLLQKPILKRSAHHMARQIEHMERVEQSLERIIDLLEKKG